MMKEFSMHILDIAQNSIRAEASTVTIEVIEDVKGNSLYFAIEDNGCGMTKEMLEKIRDPFTTSRTTRKVGLGIPMLEQTCVQCGGTLSIKSEVGVGTKVLCQMLYNNIDRPPMGDMVSTVHILVTMNTGVDFVYKHTFDGKQFVFDTREVKEVLGDVPLDLPEISCWVKDNIEEGLAEIII